MPAPLHVQGHRGARGLKPENTLPSFETAFDLGVASVETDVHLTRDGCPLLVHDPRITKAHCALLDPAAAPPAESCPLVSGLTLAQCRAYRADQNPSAARFPTQDAAVTPLARVFARERGIDPYAPPALADLVDLAAAYAGPLGSHVGKTAEQRAAAGRVVFDLELKRVPFRPEVIGDDFRGEGPGRLEERVVAELRRAGVVGRAVVRSFDHRCVRAVKALEPALRTAILVAGTAPLDPGALAREAGANLYCPDYLFLDERQVRQAHAAGVLVFPWTVNEPEDWERLVAWGVDGITTDYPDRLRAWLSARGAAAQP